MPRVLLIFLDGVGIGPDDAEFNPFLRAELPILQSLLGGRLPTLASPTPASKGARAFPVDATLGTPGLPQSGTGQIALLTGRNAARIFGRHFGPWPPVRLRPLLERENLLRAAVDAGARVVFANAYPPDFPGTLHARRVAAPPLAARAAGVLDRGPDDLIRANAVASEIVNDGWRRFTGRADLPDVSPAEAGRTLAAIASAADLTFFAHYATDTAGHRGGMEGAVAALERVDGFLGGVIERLAGDAVLLVVSDHGNVEDVRGGHTRNPALGISAGSRAPPSLAEITDVAPEVARLLAE